jgi:hypothetical protein
MRLLFLGFSSPVAGLEATRKDSSNEQQPESWRLWLKISATHTKQRQRLYTSRMQMKALK